MDLIQSDCLFCIHTSILKKWDFVLFLEQYKVNLKWSKLLLLEKELN